MTDKIFQVMDSYANYSMRSGGPPDISSGAPDINALSYLPFEEPADQPPQNGRLVLVLVEPRILEPIDGIGPDEGLTERLERFKGDLRAEGMHSRFIAADLYDGDEHKDGLTLLALRRFLIDINSEFSRFEGVLLVGSFPEASLVRRWSWASPHACSNPVWTDKTPHLTIVPEPVSPRSEIVLADLTGRWEHIYHRNIDIPAWLAKPTDSMGDSWRSGETIQDCTFTSNDYVTGNVQFNDCFYIDDANFSLVYRNDQADPKLIIKVRTPLNNPEVSADDRSSPNVTARPDICVSRINASNLARDPDPSKTGSDGKGFLDTGGNPRVVPTTNSSLVPNNQTLFFTEFNPALERRLYNRFFDRNHRFRIGGWSNEGFRPGSISGSSDFKASNYVNILNEAATDFGQEVTVDDASPCDYVKFLETPAIFKYVIVHSSPWNSAFEGVCTPTELEASCGGAPFRWDHDGNAYHPSFNGQGGTVDWFVHRALFHHKALEDAPACLMIHGGCDVNTVAGTNTAVHSDVNYARWQNAEGIVFGGTAVALLSRAKTFNDAPVGMGTGLGVGRRANFGNAWKHYYETQAGDAALATNVVQNKRAYFWSITGDWTLRLRNKNGLGLLKLDGNKICDEAIHPDQAWIGGWNFDGSRHFYCGKGDFDGNDQDSIVVQSEWGLGIVKHDGVRWRQLFGAPRDAWFGDWRWDARVNEGRDRVRAVGNFTDTQRDELLVTSSWGIGVLRYDDGKLNATRAYETGTRIGGWVYDVEKTRHWGTGDFDGDGHTELLVWSAWGAGLLSFENNTHIAMHKSGDRLGGWNLNTAVDRPVMVGDFDGDGQDEFLIKSPWGIGVLKHIGNQLKAVAMHPWGSDLGEGYVLDKGDGFRQKGRFFGGTKDALLVTRNDAWFVLSLSGDRLHAVSKLDAGERYGGWRFDPAKNFARKAAQLAGNGKDQIVVTSRWGLGVLEVDENKSPTCHALHPFDDMLGNWHLTSTDYIAGPNKRGGHGNAESLVILKRRP